MVALLDLAVDELAAVHGRDLPHEVDSMRVSLRMGHEELFILRLVAAQRQHVVQPEEIEVDQRILDIVFRLPAADQVRHDFDAVFLLDGGRDAYRAGAAAHDVPFDAAVGAHRLLDAFAVERHVDVGWVEADQPVDASEDAAAAVSLERRQQFEGKARTAFRNGFIDDVYDIHGVSDIMRYEFFNQFDIQPAAPGIVEQLFGVDRADREVVRVGQQQSAECLPGIDHVIFREFHARGQFGRQQVENLALERVVG